MSEEKEKRIKIGDLPVPETELTEEEEKDIAGGLVPIYMPYGDDLSGGQPSPGNDLQRGQPTPELGQPSPGGGR